MSTVLTGRSIEETLGHGCALIGRQRRRCAGDSARRTAARMDVSAIQQVAHEGLALVIAAGTLPARALEVFRVWTALGSVRLVLIRRTAA